jgi:hypothetical protein
MQRKRRSHAQGARADGQEPPADELLLRIRANSHQVIAPAIGERS